MIIRSLDARARCDAFISLESDKAVVDGCDFWDGSWDSRMNILGKAGLLYEGSSKLPYRN